MAVIKRWMLILIFVLTFCSLAGCNTLDPDDIQLVSYSVVLKEDDGRYATEVGRDDFLLPTTLTYSWVLTYTGDLDEVVVDAETQPHEELAAVLGEGFLREHRLEYSGTGLAPGRDGEFLLAYCLGTRDTSGRNQQAELPPPPQVLKNIRQYASRADIIIKYNGSEICRF